MKRNINVIQIKGAKGLIIAGFVVTCLIAGFIVFPGWVGMNLWNYISNYFTEIPKIGLFQGILLWGIILISYLLFRKEKVVVCMRTPDSLNEEELKSVFADIKKQSLDDPILHAMMKAREAELKYKAQQELDLNKSEQPTETDSTKV